MIFYHLCFDNGQNLELDLADVESMSAFVHKLRNFHPKLRDTKLLNEALDYFNSLVGVSCGFHGYKVKSQVYDFVDMLFNIKQYDPTEKVVFGNFADLTEEELLTVKHLTIPEFVWLQHPERLKSYMKSGTNTLGIIPAYRCGDKTFRI